MNIALIYDNIEHQNTTAMLLDNAGYTVNLACSITSPWVNSIQSDPPDILVISVSTPSETLLQQLSIFRDNIICPVVVLAMNADVNITEQTMLAGAHSCITGKISPERMQSFIRVTITRYQINLNQIQKIIELEQEITLLENQLNDKQDVEKAKGLLMQSYKMSENDACTALSKMAMDTGNKLAEVARNVISISKVLN